jgi:hypothetical protein
MNNFLPIIDSNIIGISMNNFLPIIDMKLNLRNKNLMPVTLANESSQHITGHMMKLSPKTARSLCS